jgi:hypothetical protein
MYPRTNYEMSEEDLNKVLDACKPTPVMYIGGGIPIGGSQQKNANRAWEELGRKMGFDSTTVQPIPSKGNRFFSAVPLETEQARQERASRENEEARKRMILQLTEEIEERKEKLRGITLDDEIESYNASHKD